MLPKSGWKEEDADRLILMLKKRNIIISFCSGCGKPYTNYKLENNKIVEQKKGSCNDCPCGSCYDLNPVIRKITEAVK